MHICFVTSEFPDRDKSTGGVGTMIYTLSEALAKNGIDVSVIFLATFSENVLPVEKINDFYVYRINHSNWKKFSFVDNYSKINKAIAQLHSEKKIDAIETPELGLAFLKKIQGIKYVIRLHGGHHFFSRYENKKKSPWKVYQEKKSFQKADAIIAVSEFVGKMTKELVKFDQKYSVIYNPVNTERFKPTAKPPVPGRIIFVGTVCEKKGVRQLVLGFPKVAAQFPNAHLHIVGRDWYFPDGSSYIERLKRQIPEIIKDRVVFVGRVPAMDIPEIIAEAEVLAYPSHMEAHPLAWLEALAMGKAFVGSNTGPGPEVVNDKIDGLLADPHNPDDIADKILCLLGDKDYAARLGKQARETVVSRFGVDKVIFDNIQFYQNLTNK
jgi:glycosyltransferase involved in cell wall biosynthesis